MRGEGPESSGRDSRYKAAGVRAPYIEIDLRRRAGKPVAQSRFWQDHIGLAKIAAALICGGVLGALVAWHFASPSQPLGPASDGGGASQGSSPWSARAFYLSKIEVPGGAAQTACSAGFHMASIYEVLNVSALRYETTLGIEVGDLGQGPPGLSYGWIKTGLVGDPMHTCNGWTSSAPGQYQGFAIRLNALAGSPAPAFGLQPWEFLGFGDKETSASCDVKHNVWCIHD